MQIPTGKRKAKSQPLSAVAQQEVIVIDDSDSDDDTVEIVELIGGKRRKLNPNSYVAPVPQSSEPTGGELSKPPSPNQGTSAQQFSAFGAPVLLQGSTDALAVARRACSSGTSTPETREPVNLASGQIRRNAPTVVRRACSSGTPTPEAREVNLASGKMRASRPRSHSKTEVDVVDVDLAMSDWGTGDDEYADNGPTRNAASGSDAFSVLMSSLKENEVWKEAGEAEDKSFRPSKANGGRRKAPFYKVMQGMPIAVDAFKYGAIPKVTAYFLTHAHSDHYTNLSSSWKHGPIYCSQGTANLIIHMLSVDKKWVHPLPMDTPTVIANTGGVTVTLIEANHCPGSCLFFFEGRQTVDAGDSTFSSPYVGSPRTFRYLHCGDFRASPQHVLHPAVKGKIVDQVYLDTTYLDPKYTFPAQPLVVSACADLAAKIAGGDSTEAPSSIASWFGGVGKGKGKAADKPTLFVVGTYSIGKERIVKAVAKALQSKIYCEKRKAGILRCQADPELHAMLTSNPSDSVVHLLPLGMITSDKLKPYLERFSNHFSKIVGFRPTGWTYVQPSGTDQQPSVNTILTRTVQKGYTLQDLKPNGKSTANIQMYPVPYSEHSSFYELTCFAMSFNWSKMIATVNVGSERSRGKMAKWFERWEAERKRRGKVEVIPYRHIEYW